MKDMHIHLENGPYNLSWVEQFIKQAKIMQLNQINFVEHSIRFKEFHPTFENVKNYNEYQRNWFNEKEKVAKNLSDYKELIEKVKEKNYGLTITFGIEVCYFDDKKDLIGEILQDNFFDNVTGSVHWIDNWTFNQRKNQWKDKDVNYIYKRYYEIENQLIKSDIFNIIAHPDLIKCHGFTPNYDLTDTYINLCKTAVKHNVSMEESAGLALHSDISLLGLSEQFLKIAKEFNVNLLTASDAHYPKDVGKYIKEMTELIN